MINQTIISIGSAIHDALRFFSQVSNKDWIRSNLEGGCAVGSFLLLQELKKVGIEATFACSSTHCWIEYDGIGYDITACQFHVMNGNILLDMESTVKVATFPSNEPPTGYSYRDRIDSLTHVMVEFPQGQRPKGYVLTWDGNRAIIRWRGKNKVIG